jgi:ankyrin repeat protein
LASRYGHAEIVKLLLENGADVHAENDSALRWASERGHTEIVKLLQDHIAKEKKPSKKNKPSKKPKTSEKKQSFDDQIKSRIQSYLSSETAWVDKLAKFSHL